MKWLPITIHNVVSSLEVVQGTLLRLEECLKMGIVRGLVRLHHNHEQVVNKL